jgi:lysyl-tRNA synthetase class I
MKSETWEIILYGIADMIGISHKEAFEAMYKALFGKKYGPKLASYISQNEEAVIKRLKEVKIELEKYEKDHINQ